MSPRYTWTVEPRPELFKVPDLGDDKQSLSGDFRRYYGTHLAQDHGSASGHYLFTAMALTLRDRLFEQMKQIEHRFHFQLVFTFLFPKATFYKRTYSNPHMMCIIKKLLNHENLR